jgi:mannose-6-phosphate isomerase-like protein (cupin superfamily)
MKKRKPNKKIFKHNTMKNLLVVLALISISVPGRLLAQDWARVNPEMNNILTDTTLLRATVATIEPGVKSELHSHPASFFYALTDGKIKVHYADGQIETFELKAGEYGYGDPEKPHQTENIGEKTIKFLLIELKEHPYVSSK